jgi:hypothetical protein
MLIIVVLCRDSPGPPGSPEELQGAPGVTLPEIDLEQFLLGRQLVAVLGLKCSLTLEMVCSLP